MSMQACSQHVQFQLPNELTRVRNLLDAIENDDAGLQAAMASIEQDAGPGGMRGNFELAAAHLLPKDPVTKKRLQAGKRSAAEIASTTATSTRGKSGIGSTGVHLRYHKPAEYDKLSAEQKKELSDWRKSKGTTGEKSGKKSKLDRPTTIAAFQKQVTEMKKLLDSSKNQNEDAAAKAYIMSLFNGGLPKAKEEKPSATLASVDKSEEIPSDPVIEVPKNVTLASILKRAEEAKGAGK